MNENTPSPLANNNVGTQANSSTPQPVAPIVPGLSGLSLIQIISKTMPFFILRAGVALAVSVVFVLYSGICVLLVGALAGTSFAGGATVVAIIMFIAALGVWRFVRSYFLYMVKAGHIAVVSELVVRGEIPGGDQIAYGLSLVKRYFLAANGMYVLDNLIRRAITEIRTGLDTLGGFLSFIPGIKVVQSVFGIFINVLLGYSDEAIFGYIFQKGETNIWKAAADGVVLYVQNWKEMLKSAGLVTAFLLGAGGLTAAFGFALYSISVATNLNVILVIAISFSAFLIIKWVFMDPIIMIFMTRRYLSAATSQQPAVDMYEKIKGISRKFREILDRASAPAVAPVETISSQQPGNNQ